MRSAAGVGCRSTIYRNLLIGRVRKGTNGQVWSGAVIVLTIDCDVGYDVGYNGVEVEFVMQVDISFSSTRIMDYQADRSSGLITIVSLLWLYQSGALCMQEEISGGSSRQTEQADSDPARVGLFVTCLVDLHRPSVGFAAIKLLEHTGCSVEVPELQTCCGQPAFNSGDDDTSRQIARQVIEAFAHVDYVVVPSGSCAGMLIEHYPELFRDDPPWQAKAAAFASRCHELLSFLVDVRGVTEFGAAYADSVTYHDSCSGLRELGIKQQPRSLMQQVAGLQLKEMEDTDVCCGFGGTFCVKYPDISERMVGDKVALAKQTGANTLVGGDMGCLLNISGRLSRLEQPMRVYHVAEILANMADGAAIAEPTSK